MHKDRALLSGPDSAKEALQAAYEAVYRGDKAEAAKQIGRAEGKIDRYIELMYEREYETNEEEDQ